MARLPKNIIKASRNQKAEYSRGSVAHNKPFVYGLQVVKQSGPRTEYFVIEGEERADSKSAIQSAWTATKEYLAQFGEVQKSDDYYFVNLG